MRILRATLSGVAAAGFLTVSLAAAAGQTMGRDAMHSMPMTGTMTKEQKIASASSAAPAAVAAKATILDWPAKEGAEPTVLRAGTNGFSCFPDMPETEGNDPMCLDKSFVAFIDAYLKHAAPSITSLGIGYMIAPGGGYESNTDPFATAKTATNQWMQHPPHLMLAVPDTKTLEGISTDPNNGGPYVMWMGTPYAHIMAPVTSPATTMKTGQ